MHFIDFCVLSIFVAFVFFSFFLFSCVAFSVLFALLVSVFIKVDRF